MFSGAVSTGFLTVLWLWGFKASNAWEVLGAPAPQVTLPNAGGIPVGVPGFVCGNWLAVFLEALWNVSGCHHILELRRCYQSRVWSLASADSDAKSVLLSFGVDRTPKEASRDF